MIYVFPGNNPAALNVFITFLYPILESFQQLPFSFHLQFWHRLKPGNSPSARSMTAGETGSQKIAASRRFPIQHFSRTEYPWQSANHQSRIQDFERNPACRADRFLHRARRDELNRQGLDRSPQKHRIKKILRAVLRPEFQERFRRVDRLFRGRIRSWPNAQPVRGVQHVVEVRQDRRPVMPQGSRLCERLSRERIELRVGAAVAASIACSTDWLACRICANEAESFCSACGCCNDCSKQWS